MTDEPKRSYHRRKRERTPLEKQRDTAWQAFSRYIRLRDCLKTSGNIYQGACCTCGRTYGIGKLQAGHFMPGRMDSILFDPDMVHAQCYRCNVLMSGMWPAYYRYMEALFGKETIDVMIDEWMNAGKQREMTIVQLRAVQSLYIMEAGKLERRR